MNDPEKAPMITGSNASDWYDQNGEATSNDYAVLGNKYRLLSDEVKGELTTDIINTVKQIDGPEKDLKINLQLCHWFRTDMNLGMAVANGLNINLQDLMKTMPRT